MENLRLYHVGLTAWVCLSYMIFVALDGSMVVYLIQEDGIVEWIGALGFLAASAIFLFLFFRVDSTQDHFLFRTRRNIFFLAFGVLLFVGFGEEISWGQRLIGFDTPQLVSRINKQNEFNIHNLIQNDRFFSIFWFLYCIILPIARLIKLPGYSSVEKIRLPVVSLWIGSVFMVNYAISKVFEALYVEFLHGIVELKEANFAILFLFVGMYFWLCARSKTSSSVNWQV